MSVIETSSSHFSEWENVLNFNSWFYILPYMGLWDFVIWNKTETLSSWKVKHWVVKSETLSSWKWNIEFVKVKHWVRESETLSCEKWNTEFVKVKHCEFQTCMRSDTLEMFSICEVILFVWSTFVRNTTKLVFTYSEK